MVAMSEDQARIAMLEKALADFQSASSVRVAELKAEIAYALSDGRSNGEEDTFTAIATVLGSLDTSRTYTVEEIEVALGFREGGR